MKIDESSSSWINKFYNLKTGDLFFLDLDLNEFYNQLGL